MIFNDDVEVLGWPGSKRQVRRLVEWYMRVNKAG
jgi:hypothetical protein